MCVCVCVCILYSIVAEPQDVKSTRRVTTRQKPQLLQMYYRFSSFSLYFKSI